MRLFVLLLPLGATACVERPPGSAVFEEGFEGYERCPTGSCDWQVTGTVEQITTLHPEQHALRLSAGAAIERKVDIRRDANFYGSDTNDGHWIEYTSTCPGSPRLELASDGTSFGLTVTLPAGGGDRFELTHSNLPPFDDPPPPDPSRPIRLPIHRLRVVAGNPGCTIDHLAVVLPETEYGQ